MISEELAGHTYCPSREILELIGGKWSLLILCALKAGPVRTGALSRSLEGISQKMLTQTLRDLMRSGMIVRTSYPEVPPRVEYSLTPLGQTLSVLVLQFEQWVADNYQQVTAAQVAFDANHVEETMVASG
ncbi:MarR family transcriptional regulator [Reticulibacter mediterranei]|uniref:MarR family transcriptional regulator n=1 Tax=Reticulibacter mediterranei TaxID=2778369 RepID=A0A8J3N717_9CHLR|nr:helix-turn-helix domain-containing protein [Reticulibacter mediterranei]GHP00973.1 MarR family transcriptional regulator [Reticulibacter mediterranei]